MTTSHPIDLAAEQFGGRALLANDEFFAPKENLLHPGRGVYAADRYTDRGKWMDGWETRRRRTPGHDWCLVQLGMPGRIAAVTIDTHHFKGNHPEACSVEALAVPGDPDPRIVAASTGWQEIVPQSLLQPDAENDFSVADGDRYTHVRLNIYPDGGVARFRVWGEVRPDWEDLRNEQIDLAAVENGGIPIAASDEFFSKPLNLVSPGRGISMADGWETRRRRGPGHDWVILRLGHRGTIDEIEVDTLHFKGNYPDSCSLEGIDLSDGVDPDDADAEWFKLLHQTRLGPDARHTFAPIDPRPVTHVRFNIYPDGGVSRLRLWGHLE